MRLKLLPLLVLLFAGCSGSGVSRWIPFLPKKTSTVGLGAPPVVKSNKGSQFGPVTGTLAYGLEMRLVVAPINLAESRTFEARIQLINRTRKVINLTFSDNREFDLILRDATGKRLVQWSDDQPLTQGPAYIIINPDERSEHVADISSRDMVPGRTYQLEAHITGYDRLTVVQNIVPQK
jgi:Intracellular proteinase inhibitor